MYNPKQTADNIINSFLSEETVDSLIIKGFQVYDQDALNKYKETLRVDKFNGQVSAENFKKAMDEISELKPFRITTEKGFQTVLIRKSLNKALDNFDEIVSDLFNAQALLEHCHRQTKSEPVHEALDEAYNGVAELKDKIIEQIIGLTGKRYDNINLTRITGYNPAMCLQAADAVINAASRIELTAEENDLSSVSNLAQELNGVGAKLKYKLSLDNGDEMKNIEKAFTTLDI